MTLLEQLQADLLRKRHDDKALSRLLSAKRDLSEYSPPMAVKKDYDDAMALLKDIPLTVSCECCGKNGLVHVYRKGASIVGSECRREEVLGSCRKR